MGGSQDLYSTSVFSQFWEGKEKHKNLQPIVTEFWRQNLHFFVFLSVLIKLFVPSADQQGQLFERGRYILRQEQREVRKRQW